jgi:hypothetical protein
MCTLQCLYQFFFALFSGSLLSPYASRAVPSYRAAPVPTHHPKTGSTSGPTPRTTLTRHVRSSHHRGCGGFRSRSGRRPAPRLGLPTSQTPFPAARSDAVWGRQHGGRPTLCAAAAKQHGAAGGAGGAARADGGPAAAECGALLWRARGGPGGAARGGGEGGRELGLDVMKRERVRLRDHRGKALGTTCLTISSVKIVVAIAFLVMFFVIRFT